MPSTSPKLQLQVPSQVDPFSTKDVADNWGKIDDAPGILVCTSTTRPAWTSAQAGRQIRETNTGLGWLWNGTTWERTGAVGLLKRTDGSFAIAERTTPFPTTSTTYKKVLALTNVVVPDGKRPIRVDVSWVTSKNTVKAFMMAIYRSDADATPPMMAHWTSGNSGDTDDSGGGTYWTIERNGLAAGTYSFSFQIHSVAGTSTVGGDASTPITVMATEL